MSEFLLPLLKKKFSELDVSQESVETISLWMIHHRRHAATIVKYWSERFNVSSETRKLALLFVVNDILRSNKIKSKIYNREFERVLPDALCRIAKNCTRKQLLNQTRRMLSIWQAQRCFQKEIIDKFWHCLDGECAADAEIISAFATKSNKSVYDPKADIEPKDLKKIFLASEAPTSQDLILALESLESLPSSDKEMRKKISNFPIKDVYSFEDKQQATKYQNELAEVVELIEDYNEQLVAEIAQREKVDNMLNAYKESESIKVADLELKMQQDLEDLKKISIVRKEIKKHRASFPDLKKYKSAEVLPPLPKVEELFKKT